MKQVTVTSPSLNVNSGRLTLSAEQARRRKHALALVGRLDAKGAGVYEVKSPVQFKAGETFGYDGEIRKDGVLVDPRAEIEARDAALRAEIAREFQERFDRALQQAQAELDEQAARALRKAQAELDEQAARQAEAVAQAGEQALAALLAKLKPETAAQVQAELGATNKAGK